MEHITTMPANWPVCIAGLLICAAGTATAFMARGRSSMIAFIGLAMIYLWGNTGLMASQFIFWGLAAMIALGICFMLPPAVSRSRMGVNHITGATLTGAMTGMVVSTAGMITGAMLGAFCGALAYSRTPGGRALEFPSSKFLHYLCAKGLPAVVTVCIFCLALASVLGI